MYNFKSICQSVVHIDHCLSLNYVLAYFKLSLLRDALLPAFTADQITFHNSNLEMVQLFCTERTENFPNKNLHMYENLTGQSRFCLEIMLTKNTGQF